MNNEFKLQLAEDAKLIEEALERYLPPSNEKYKIINEAMRYSLLGGGKRLRAALALEFCREFRGAEEDVLPFCSAIEMVQAYSLIHDDLPCMDDDALRRGKPSCHIAYGESTALLAGDALLTKAFELMLSQTKLPADIMIKAAHTLAKAIGENGMIGGQVLDLAQEGKKIEAVDIEETDRLKTGALICASAEIGCIVGRAKDEVYPYVRTYAHEIGLAFQITDDILDETSTPERLGKPIGSDGEKLKTTYTTAYGINGAKQIATQCIERAKQALTEAKIANIFLYQLADYILHREN